MADASIYGLTPSCEKIDWLSYSGLAKLRRCALSAAFARDSATKHWSRSSPGSCLGTARHQIVEEITLGLERGLDAPSAEWISKRFDYLLADQARRLASDWAPAGVPSIRRWSDVAYVRARLLRQFAGPGDNECSEWPSYDAQRPRKWPGGDSHFQPPLHPEVGTTLSEVWLQDPDRKLHGQIDQLVNRDGSLIVVDMKSGVGVDANTLLQRHREQMLFYAGLVESSFGAWPELEIASANDATIPVPYSPSEVDSLRSDAVNERVSFNDGLDRKDMLTTCSVSLEVCAWCPFQVACGPFQESWFHLAEITPSDEMRSISLVGGLVQNVSSSESSVDVHISHMLGLGDVNGSVVVTRLPAGLEMAAGDVLVIAGIETSSASHVLRARWDSRIRVIPET